MENLKNYYEMLSFVYENIPEYNQHLYKEIKRSHLFQIDTKLNECLLKTNNRIYSRNLPFVYMFIPNDILIDNKKIGGLFLHDSKSGTYILTPIYKDETHYNLKLFVFQEKEHQRLIKKCNKDGIKNFLKDEKLKYKIKLYICNFLDFLNTPDVEIKEIVWSEEANKKRIKRGKPPIPTIHNVTVTGKTKEYINNFHTHNKNNYSHKFDVRGHWRTLKSERYGENVGKRIWIPNYIKGDGIYIKKRYDVEN